MSLKGGKAPKPPDYLQAAQEQGRANLEAIRTQAALNRVNQVTPYGSIRYRQPQPIASASPQAQTADILDRGSMGSLWGRMADQIQVNQPSAASGGDQWEQIVTLSPNQQAILDARERNQIDMGKIAGSRLNQLGEQGQIDLSGLPSRVSSVGPSNFRTDVNSPGVRYEDLNLSGLAGLPGSDDFSGERQRVEDALYGRFSSRLDPQFGQREAALRTQLINSGIREGSEAWNNAFGDFERDRQSAYDQARTSAVLAGGNEQSRLLTDALTTRRQQFGERLGQGQFGNEAANQALQAELARLGLFNASEADLFQQGVANAGLSAAARDAGLREDLLLRDRPLQEFLQLYGGADGGINPPPIPQVGAPIPPDIFGATQAGYQGQIDQYNANQARNSQNAGGLLSLASILASAYSDRRLKRDIERVGTLPSGLPTYRFRYFNEDVQRIGVMSDDVMDRFPEAVIVGSDGFDRVDYAAIGAAHLLEWEK